MKKPTSDIVDEIEWILATSKLTDKVIHGNTVNAIMRRVRLLEKRAMKPVLSLVKKKAS